MRKRKLGKTEWSVSEIGYGAWGIGGGMWQGSDDRESERALNAAIDEGVNFIDTALEYGGGHSEKLVGKLIRERSEEIYVATKAPPKNSRWPAAANIPADLVFPPEHVIDCAERSLRNLKLDRIDIFQFHVWHDALSHETGWLDAIAQLKEEEKIRFFGVSVNDHQPENSVKIVEQDLVDTVQVIYNIFDQSPEESLFPACIEHNTGVIVRVPFDEGGLTGTITTETTFPPRDWRNRYFRGDRKQQVRERVREIERLLGEEAETLPELALRFCLSHPAVSTVIPGMRTEKNVRANCAVSDGRLLSDELREELKKHRWQRNFYE
jgi:aryl-alcohol dehydrogenase-like predicted oxidoreductase